MTTERLAPPRKRIWQRIDGVLLLDKPLGLSSNTALQAARRLFSAAKAGHTGTLDPLASGLLPLCFGEATKFSADLLEADKTYEAEVFFGARTATGDAEGDVIERFSINFSERDLAAVLARFRGLIKQIPPMYSALKRDGKPLYELARQGLEVERAAREVTIHTLDLLEFSGVRARLRIVCSKGTYIRTLAEDIAKALDNGAHLTALRRTAVGPLSLDNAHTLDGLSALAEETRLSCLLPPDALLQSLPAVQLTAPLAMRFRLGNAVVCAALPFVGRCRVYSHEQGLLGLGEVDHAACLHPRRLLIFDPKA